MAADTRVLEILFKIRSDLTELQKLHGGLDTTKGKLNEVSASADTFKQSLIGGFVGGATVGAISSLTNALSEIPRAFTNAIKDGVRFNATLESSQLGVAAIIKQFDTGGKFKNFDDALGAAGNAIDLLREKALKSPATFEQLVGAFQGVSGAASAANIPLSKQVDLVVLMSQALAGLGIRSDQILQESRALLTGNITEDAMAARILGITSEQVNAAKTKGQLFDFLTEKLSAFAEAGSRGEQSFTTQVSNISDALTQLKGVGTEAIFEQIKDGLHAINEELARPQTREMFAGAGAALGDLSRAGAETLRVLQSIGSYAQYAAPAFLGLKAAINSSFEAGAVNEFIESQVRLRGVLADQIGSATQLKDQNEARRQLDEAIADLQVRQSQASGDMRDAITNALSVLEPMRRNFEAMVGTTAQVASNIGDISAAIERAAALRKVEFATQLATAEAVGDEKQILDLKTEQLRADTADSLIKKDVDPEEAWKAAEDLVFATRAKLQAEIDAKNTKKESAAIDKSAAGDRRAEAAEKRAETEAMRELQAQKSTIQSDPFALTAEKRAQLIPILQAEAAALREAGHEWEALRVEQQLATLSFTGGVQANLVSWVNGFGTTAQGASNVITGTLNSAISQTSKLLTDAIFRTGDWEQALASVGETGVQMLIEFALQQLITHTLGETLKGQSTTTSVAQGAAIATAHAPAAAATSISSWGTAAIVGAALALVAIGAIIGVLASGGFESGGYTGGRRRKPAGVVHGEEYVFDAESVDRIGVGALDRIRGYATGGRVGSFTDDRFLEDLNARRFPLQMMPGYAEGGRVSGQPGGASVSSAARGRSPEVHVYNFTDRDKFRKALLESTEGRKIIIDTIEGARIDLGLGF